MKLNTRDIDDLMNDDDETVETKNKVRNLTAITNKMQRIRNSVSEKHEDNKVYGNRDKTRFKN